MVNEFDIWQEQEPHGFYLGFQLGCLVGAAIVAWGCTIRDRYRAVAADAMQTG